MNNSPISATQPQALSPSQEIKTGRSLEKRVAILSLGIIASTAAFALLPMPIAWIATTAITVPTINCSFGPFSSANPQENGLEGGESEEVETKKRRPIRTEPRQVVVGKGEVHRAVGETEVQSAEFWRNQSSLSETPHRKVGSRS